MSFQKTIEVIVSNLKALCAIVSKSNAKFRGEYKPF